MKRTVTLTNKEVEIVMGYMEGNDYCFKKSNNKVCTDVSWAMFGNRKVLFELSKKIDEYKAELNNTYIGDDKSYVTKDAEGNDVRRIREEYYDTYNKELTELDNQKNDITIDTISIKDLKDCTMDDIDYTMIGMFLEENEDYVGPGHEKEDVAVEVVE